MTGGPLSMMIHCTGPGTVHWHGTVTVPRCVTACRSGPSDSDPPPPGPGGPGPTGSDRPGRGPAGPATRRRAVPAGAENRA
eukprot:749848-Hanusia_phi.AAC.1